MKARWLKRDNNGVDEKFYPITHVDAIVMGEDDKPMGEHFKDTNNPHNVTAEQIGALPKTGGTLSGKELNLNGGSARFGTNGNTVWMSTRNVADNASNARAFLIASSNIAEINSRALQFEDIVNGKSTYYALFGEHNKELLASAVENLMANGGMSTLQSAIQITNAAISDTDSAFTGTGKGRLFISSPTNLSAYVTIDGKSIGTANARSTFEVDFLQSFSVKASGTSGLHCTAVFY